MHHGLFFKTEKTLKPWITEETLEIMKKRDQAKEDHKRLSLIDSSSRETKDAWELYKILRNRVTHLKRNEEDNYKRKQVENNSDVVNSEGTYGLEKLRYTKSAH